MHSDAPYWRGLTSSPEFAPPVISTPPGPEIVADVVAGIDPSAGDDATVVLVYDEGDVVDVTHRTLAERARIADNEARRLHFHASRRGTLLAVVAMGAALRGAITQATETMRRLEAELARATPAAERMREALRACGVERLAIDECRAVAVEDAPRSPARTLARGHDVNPYAAGRRRPRHASPGPRAHDAPAPPVLPTKALARTRKT